MKSLLLLPFNTSATILSILTSLAASYSFSSPPHRSSSSLVGELQNQRTATPPASIITNGVVNYNENINNDRRRPKSQPLSQQQRRRLPLVDSDLLRFLSNQQQQEQQQQLSRDNNNNNNAFLNLVGDSQQPMPDSLKLQTTTSFTVDESDNNDIAMQQWLQMYQKESILQLLFVSSTEPQQQRDKIDPHLAEQAAEAVQTVAMTRASRLRIRKYLRQRNQLFNNNNNCTTTTATSSSSSSSSPHKEVSKPTLHEDVEQQNTNTASQNIDLLLSYGLSIKDIAEILVHTPGVAFMQTRPIKLTPTTATTNTKDSVSKAPQSLQETLERILDGLLMGRTQPHHLGLRKYDARKILRATPGLLSLRGSKNAEDIVLLLTRLGVTSNSISRQIASIPTLLTRPPAAVFRLVAFLASDAVRMPIKNIGPLLRRNECQPLLDAVAASSITTRHMSAVEAQIRRAVVESTYRRMSTTAWTLRHEIGTADLGKLIAANPSVLLLDATRQILPIANYLMEDLGIFENDLPRVLQQFPALLSRDLEQIQLIVNYLLSLEVAPENLGVIIRSFPHLLTLDIEHDMIPVVNFLKQEIGINNVGRFVTRLPPVLGYSVEKELIPKWQFLNAMFIDARFEVSKFPAYFSYPLERVIKSRFEYLKTVKKVPIPLMALDQVLRYGDRDFAVKIARDLDGHNYAAFAEARRKSMSKSSGKTEETNNSTSSKNIGRASASTMSNSPSSASAQKQKQQRSSPESNSPRPKRQSPPPPETPPLSPVSS